jgi:hypothetical protein
MFFVLISGNRVRYERDVVCSSLGGLVNKVPAVRFPTRSSRVQFSVLPSFLSLFFSHIFLNVLVLEILFKRYLSHMKERHLHASV